LTRLGHSRIIDLMGGLRVVPVAARLSGLVATLVLAAASAPAARAEPERPVVYRWVDEEGIAHYTAHRDRVPSALRGQIEEIRPTVPSGAPTDGAAPTSGPAAASTGAASATAMGVPAAAPTAPSSEESAWATENVGPPAPRAHEALGKEKGTSGETRVASRETRAPTSDLDARIATLEAQIANDEDAIKNLLSTPPAEGATPLPQTPEFREIARRLPKLQADLQALREKRDRAGGSATDAPSGSDGR
jgi:uncharacterized coiled-coil protein SlyX